MGPIKSLYGPHTSTEFWRRERHGSRTSCNSGFIRKWSKVTNEFTVEESSRIRSEEYIFNVGVNMRDIGKDKMKGEIGNSTRNKRG